MGFSGACCPAWLWVPNISRAAATLNIYEWLCLAEKLEWEVAEIEI